MVSISSLREKQDMPYQLPLRVAVLGVASRRSYTNNGEEREFLPVVVGDATGAMRINLYDLSRESMLTTGKSVLLRGYILRSERYSRKKYLVVTSVTKIFSTSSVNVPAEVREEGQNILNPPPAPQMSMEIVKKSPIKTVVSVKGQIVSEEVPKMWKVDGKEVKVKSVNIKDDTGTCRVSLWRAQADASISTGDYVSITNVIVSNYPKNEISLSTTSTSNLTKMQQPAQQKQITVEGYEENEEDYSLCVSIDGEFVEEAYTVSKLLINQHLGLEQDVICLDDLLPLKFNVKIVGSKITEFLEES